MISANYYDGQSAHRHAVTLSFGDNSLYVSGTNIEKTATLSELSISEPLGRAPRLITFPDGAFCEIYDHDALIPLLSRTNHRDKLFIRWQFSLKAVCLALVISITIFFVGYQWALPAVAETVAGRLPDSVGARLSQEAWKALDGTFLESSQLPIKRQELLAQHFANLRQPNEQKIPHSVEFRRSKSLGANALALPSGTIVITDELIKLAKNDQEIMGVLAHELGHVHYRHGIRTLLQSAAVALVTAWLFGDVSSAAAALSTTLLESRYSREFEKEADLYAARMLKANGIPPSSLANMLERMESQAKTDRKKNAESPDFPDQFSTHPATAERAQTLRLLD